MQFAKESRVSHPARLVVETMVERMEAIVPFLPSIEAIETLEREPLDPGPGGEERLRILRRWQGSLEGAPRAARPFLTREAVQWLDHAVWTPSAHKVDWRLETKLSGLYVCSGTNYFEPHPEASETETRIRITGTLTVHPERLPVPGFMARRLAPQVERFVIGLIAPNLTDVAKGLQGYLDAQAGLGSS